MQCKKCGKDLSGEEYRMVAEWPFCMECFHGLMEKRAKKVEPEEEVEASTEPEREKEDVSVEGVFETAKRRCTLCEKEIEGDQYKKVGIWTFCPECYRDMAPRPKPPPPPEPEVEAVDEEEEAMKARFRIKYMHRVKCAGCGRMIPEGGSKQVDEEAYCPDCYYGLPEEVRQAAEKVAAAAMAGKEAAAAEIGQEEAISREVHELETPEGCESCGKKLAADKLQTVKGFAICQACLSADADLAVHLARARHQKRLQKLKEVLGE
jgi:hypothetical protein